MPSSLDPASRTLRIVGLVGIVPDHVRAARPGAADPRRPGLLDLVRRCCGAVYLALFTCVLLRPPRRRWLVHAAMAAECVLVLILLARVPEIDFMVALFVPLAFQAAFFFAGRTVWIWVAALAVLIAGSLMLFLGPLRGLSLALVSIAIEIILAAFVIVAREIETARRREPGDAAGAGDDASAAPGLRRPGRRAGDARRARARRARPQRLGGADRRRHPRRHALGAGGVVRAAAGSRRQRRRGSAGDGGATTVGDRRRGRRHAGGTAGADAAGAGRDARPHRRASARRASRARPARPAGGRRRPAARPRSRPAATSDLRLRTHRRGRRFRPQVPTRIRPALDVRRRRRDEDGTRINDEGLAGRRCLMFARRSRSQKTDGPQTKPDKPQKPRLGAATTAATGLLAGERRYDISWLRILAVLLLFPFHTARVFNIGEEFYVKNDQLSGASRYFVAYHGAVAHAAAVPARRGSDLVRTGSIAAAAATPASASSACSCRSSSACWCSSRRSRISVC